MVNLDGTNSDPWLKMLKHHEKDKLKLKKYLNDRRKLTMAKDKLNLDKLMNNLNQAGLNVINFDEHFQEQILDQSKKIKMDSTIVENILNEMLTTLTEYKSEDIKYFEKKVFEIMSYIKRLEK